MVQLLLVPRNRSLNSKLPAVTLNSIFYSNLAQPKTWPSSEAEYGYAPLPASTPSASQESEEPSWSLDNALKNR